MTGKESSKSEAFLGRTTEGSTERTEAPASGQKVIAYGYPGAATGWEQFWALAYYGRDGKPYLTTWMGDRPIVRMLSINCAPHRIPIWDAEVPGGALLLEWPDDPDVLAMHVRENCGHRVIGWRTQTRIERRAWDGHRASPVVAPL